jgi:hypothetical protein
MEPVGVAGLIAPWNSTAGTVEQRSSRGGRQQRQRAGKPPALPERPDPRLQRHHPHGHLAAHAFGLPQLALRGIEASSGIV